MMNAISLWEIAFIKKGWGAAPLDALTVRIVNLESSIPAGKTLLSNDECDFPLGNRIHQKGLGRSPARVPPKGEGVCPLSKPAMKATRL
jgi:hypothetical protein